MEKKLSEDSELEKKVEKNKPRIIFSKKIPLSTKDFGEMLFSGLSNNPSTVIIRDILLGREATSREIVDSSETLARHLLRLGCAKGDVVAIFSPNSIEYLVVMAATLRIGSVTAGINPLLLAGELEHQLKRCEAKFLYTTPSQVSIVRKVTSDLKQKVVVIVKEGNHEHTLDKLLVRQSDLPSLPTFDDIGLRPEDPALILFSSGTTGLPKSVLMSHRNLQGCYTAFCQPETISLYDGQLIFSSFSHAAGCYWLLGATAKGLKTNFFSRFDFVKYLEFIEANRPEFLHLMPPVATRLVKSPDTARFHLGCIKTILSSSAPMSRELEDQLMEKFPGVKIRQGLGMTETTGFSIVISPEAEERKPSSVGRPVCNAEVKVIDIATGEDLGPGHPGEVCIRSPMVMIGYLGDPEATARTIDKDGWLHTGDVAYYDEEGFFFVVDRVKDLIKYNAYQVAPAELEAVLLSHPQVADAGVFGLPDPNAGELPAAWVVRKPESTVTETELEKFVAGKVAPFKRLRGGVKFVSSIPKSPSGKILRREMRSALLKGKL